MGVYLRDRLNGLQEEYRVIGEVREIGLIQGMENVKEKKEPAPDFVAKIFERTKEQGVLIGKGRLYGNVIRITPLLTIGKADIDQAVQILDRAFEKVRVSRTYS